MVGDMQYWRESTGTMGSGGSRRSLTQVTSGVATIEIRFAHKGGGGAAFEIL